MSYKRQQLLICFCTLLFFIGCHKKNDRPAEKTFTNPLLTGADPWVYQKDSFYYYSHTLGNKVAIWKTNKITQLSSAPSSTIYTPAPGTSNAHNIWAPEIHFIDGKWYTYYTAGAGHDSTQRLWVLENSNPDPATGTWIDKGRIYASNANFWAIDGTVFEYNNNRYFLWSGRPVATVQNQNIYIAKMTNPWTLEGAAVMLTKPELPWETRGGPVNEGPQILQKKNKVFLIYSASGCWTDDYGMGMLTLKEGGDPLNASDWLKNDQPAFSKQPANNAYGPGHGSFFKSRDGQEDWMIYHANAYSNEGCGGRRNVRIQQFTWTSSGMPSFGEPVKTGAALPLPSGE